MTMPPAGYTATTPPPAALLPTPPHKKKIWPKVLAAVVILAIVIPVSFLFLSWPITTDSKTFTQPSSVKYDNATYYVSVENQRKLGMFPVRAVFPGNDTYVVYVGHDKDGNVKYGHFVSIESVGDLAKTQVSWQANGVTLQFSSGHRLFVPASEFTGGR